MRDARQGGGLAFGPAWPALPSEGTAEAISEGLRRPAAAALGMGLQGTYWFPSAPADRLQPIGTGRRPPGHRFAPTWPAPALRKGPNAAHAPLTSGPQAGRNRSGHPPDRPAAPLSYFP